MTMDFALATTKRIKDAEKELRRLGTLESPLQYNYQGDMNPVVNGNMSVHQRVSAVTVGPTLETYTLDQWRARCNGAGATITVSQQPMPMPETAFLPEQTPNYFLRWAQTVAGAGATTNRIINLIDDVRTYAGLPVVVSFWAKAAVAQTIQVRTFQSATGGVLNSYTTYNLTTSWQKFYYFSTLGNLVTAISAGSALAIEFFFPLNTVQTVDITNVQLDRGNVAANFKYESFETTLRRCLRYYQKSFSYATAPATGAGNAGALRQQLILAGALTTFMFLEYPVPMRISPVVTFYNPTSATALARNTTAGTDAAATVTGGPNSEKSLAVDVTGLAAWAQGQSLLVHWAASAEI